MRRKTIRLVATTALLTFTLAACGGPKLGEEVTADGPYRVFFTADLTGETAIVNRGLLAGMRVAADELNKEGGIAGRDVVLMVNNDQNNPTKAVSALQEAIYSGEKPDLVYPGGSSAVSFSLLPITTKENILSVGGTVAAELNDPERFPYHFGTAEPTESYGPPLGILARDAGIKKVGMVFSNDPTGQAARKVYADAAADYGFELNAVGYGADALDMTPQLEQLRSWGAEAVVFNGYGTPVQYLIRSQAGMGWDVPFYSDQLSSTFPFVTNFSDADLANIQVIQSNWTVKQEPEAEEMTQFVEQVKRQPEGDVLQTAGVRLPAVAHAALRLPAWAIQENGGDTSARAVADSLIANEHNEGRETTPWVTDARSENPYQFSKGNHFPTSPPDTFLYVNPGMYEDDGLYVPGKKP